MLKYVLFDLDGTLTDPGLGITNCVEYALNRFEIYPKNREEMYPYIGPPLINSFMDFHGLSEAEAEQAVAYYRERFSVLGMYENEVFNGIPNLLESLNNQEVSLMVATSKTEEFTHQILQHFKLSQYFTFVGGNTLKEERPTKESVIAYVREHYPDINGENAVVVGDRHFDVRGAHMHGLPAIGVLFGYGSRDEMSEAEADFVVETVGELADLLEEMVKKV